MRVFFAPLDALSPDDVTAWALLADRAAEPNPFCAPPVVRSAADVLRAGDAVRLLVVEDGGSWLFVLPVVSGRGHRGVPASALTSWTCRWSGVGTPLVDRDRVREAWAEVLLFLRGSAVEWWLALEDVAVHGPVAVALQEVLAARRVRAATVDVYDRPVVRRRPGGTPPAPALAALDRRAGLRLTDRTGEADDAAALVERLRRVAPVRWRGAPDDPVAGAELVRRVCAGLGGGGLQVWTLDDAHGRTLAGAVALHSGRTAFRLVTVPSGPSSRGPAALRLEQAVVRAFDDDPGLVRLDSCAQRRPGAAAEVYPDRDAVGSVLVPGRGTTGVVATRLARRRAR